MSSLCNSNGDSFILDIAGVRVRVNLSGGSAQQWLVGNFSSPCFHQSKINHPKMHTKETCSVSPTRSSPRSLFCVRIWGLSLSFSSHSVLCTPRLLSTQPCGRSGGGEVRMDLMPWPLSFLLNRMWSLSFRYLCVSLRHSCSDAQGAGDWTPSSETLGPPWDLALWEIKGTSPAALTVAGDFQSSGRQLGRSCSWSFGGCWFDMVWFLMHSGRD